MVHVQNASVATGAMMASFRFEDVAHEAISTPLILRIAKMKAPEHWNLAWIGSHCLDEGPHHHNEDYVEYDKHSDCGSIV